MAGDSASSAPQSVPTAAVSDTPVSTAADAAPDPTATAAPASADAPAQSSPGKRGRAAKSKATAPAPAPEPSPLRASRSSSTVAQDADQLRLEQFASRQRELDTRVDKFESRVGKVETAMANFKVDVSKAATAKDDARIRDITARTTMLERNIKDLDSARGNTVLAVNSFEVRITALEKRAERATDLEARVRSLEELAQANEAAATAALTEITELREALSKTDADVDSDWSAFVAFRDDAHGRLQRAEEALLVLQTQPAPPPPVLPRAAPQAAQPRAPSPLRRAGRHERDDGSDLEAAPKRPRRDSGVERQPRNLNRPTTPAEPALTAPVDQDDSLTIWNDGEFGEEGWVTCRIGQPERAPHEAEFLWSNNNEDNMALALKLCEMLSRKTGCCPKPIKVFAPDNDFDSTWRACQFSSRENLKRFMRFWVERPDQYRSLRAIPCADQDDVASIADLMREIKNRRARPDNRRDKNNMRDDRRDGRREDRREDRRNDRRDDRRDGRRDARREGRRS